MPARSKAFYDLYGEDALKHGIADDDGGAKHLRMLPKKEWGSD